MIKVTGRSSVKYSECYVVKYLYKDQEGFQKNGEATYYTASKGRHAEVEAYFRRYYPASKFIITHVIYQ